MAFRWSGVSSGSPYAHLSWTRWAVLTSIKRAVSESFVASRAASSGRQSTTTSADSKHSRLVSGRLRCSLSMLKSSMSSLVVRRSVISSPVVPAWPSMKILALADTISSRKLCERAFYQGQRVSEPLSECGATFTGHLEFHSDTSWYTKTNNSGRFCCQRYWVAGMPNILGFRSSRRNVLIKSVRSGGKFGR